MDNFYFKFSNITYGIPRECAGLSELFKNMMNSELNACNTQSTAYTLQPILVKLQPALKDKDFLINTQEIVEFIFAYLKSWSGEEKSSDYIKQGAVQTNKPEQILRQADLKLIDDYVNAKLDKLSEIEKNKLHDSQYMIKFHKVQSLRDLIMSVDGYFAINCLQKKLYTYVATIIKDCNLIELSEISQNEEFRKLQAAAVEEWKEKNKDKIRLANSHTSGNGQNTLFEDSDEDE